MNSGLGNVVICNYHEEWIGLGNVVRKSEKVEGIRKCGQKYHEEYCREV